MVAITAENYNSSEQTFMWNETICCTSSIRASIGMSSPYKKINIGGLKYKKSNRKQRGGPCLKMETRTRNNLAMANKAK
jgi:hypothetical protein